MAERLPRRARGNARGEAMGRVLTTTVAACGLMVLGGCSTIGPTPEAREKQQYEEFGPKFTDEEKAAMSTEQKLAVYNLNMERKDKLVCRGERPTGTRFKVTRCFTRQEMDDIRRTSQEWMREARRGGSRGF